MCLLPCAGIYAESFEKPIKLHLAEGGASNALFFFSECRKFIAKSCTAEEMTNVRTHASSLRDHFQTNRNSLITRIFGAYKLQVYSSDLYFIVTNNVLLTDSTEMITEKFDLKGSSVHRHMKLPRNGETVRCRLCGSAFVYNSKSHFRRDRDLLMNQGREDDESSVCTLTDKDTNKNSDTDKDLPPPVSLPLSPPASTHLKKTLSRRMSNRRASSASNLVNADKDKDKDTGGEGEGRKQSVSDFGNT